MASKDTVLIETFQDEIEKYMRRLDVEDLATCASVLDLPERDSGSRREILRAIQDELDVIQESSIDELFRALVQLAEHMPVQIRRKIVSFLQSDVNDELYRQASEESTNAKPKELRQREISLSEEDNLFVDKVENSSNKSLHTPLVGQSSSTPIVKEERKHNQVGFSDRFETMKHSFPLDKTQDFGQRRYNEETFQGRHIRRETSNDQSRRTEFPPRRTNVW